MKKNIFVIIIIVSLTTILSGCIDNSSNIVSNSNNDIKNNLNSQPIIGTWISPDIYGKEYYMLTNFNEDNTFESYIWGTSYNYQANGNWELIDDKQFILDQTVTTDWEQYSSTDNCDYVFVDKDTLIYGNSSTSSPGNAQQFYRLDGKFLIIFKFEANPSEIYAGSEVNLSWVVIGGSSISINNGIGTVDHIGYTKINPDETTEYIITVKDGGNIYTANTTVTIITDEQEDETSYPVATINTTKGVMKVKLFDSKMPVTVNNFIRLANEGFYDGMIFHRVMDDFMIQAGWMYPDGSTVESPYGNIAFEESDVSHVDGAISMASTGSGVGGSSQFFICDGAQKGLDGHYAAFGVVIEGIDVLRDIADEPHDSSYGTVGGGKPYTDIIINSITVEYP